MLNLVTSNTTVATAGRFPTMFYTAHTQLLTWAQLHFVLKGFAQFLMLGYTESNHHSFGHHTNSCAQPIRELAILAARHLNFDTRFHAEYESVRSTSVPRLLGTND